MVRPDLYKINGIWYHCLTVYDGKSYKRYINGVLQEDIIRSE